MSTAVSEILDEPKTPTVGRGRSDFFYYGLRNKKLVFGLGLELLLVLLAIIGPMIAKSTSSSSRPRPKTSFLFRRP